MEIRADALLRGVRLLERRRKGVLQGELYELYDVRTGRGSRRKGHLGGQ